jgi:hypothetical protein
MFIEEREWGIVLILTWLRISLNYRNDSIINMAKNILEP